MSIFDKLSNKEEKSFQELANNLVPAARINAMSMFVPLIKSFPSLEKVDTKHWDFIVSVAGIFIAATRLNNLKLDFSFEESLLEIVSNKLQELDADYVPAFEDCKNMFETEYDRLKNINYETRFIATDALGLWIVLNLFKRHPQNKEEIELVRVVGGMVTTTFFDWWQNN